MLPPFQRHIWSAGVGPATAVWQLWHASSVPTADLAQPKRSPSWPGEAPEKARALCPYEAGLP
jgi:hypothetical protein